MPEIIEAFGPRLSILIVLVGIGWFLMSWSPLIWPAFRAFRGTPRLPRPWLFSLVVAALVYGILAFAVTALLIPADAYTVFIAPQLQEMGMPVGRPLVGVIRLISMWWWIAMPPVFFGITFLVTRELAKKWPKICSAMADRSD